MAPDFYVGNITRESISTALEHGLTADMIVEYLSAHAHSIVQHRSFVVPQVR